VQLDNFKTDRRARISRIGDLTSDFFRSDTDSLMVTLDNMVDRMWPIYYPALAVSRVPASLPHTNGAILSAALQHITMPRVFFPEKAELLSDSHRLAHPLHPAVECCLRVRRVPPALLGEGDHAGLVHRVVRRHGAG